jgi:hypothetical protein
MTDSPPDNSDRLPDVTLTAAGSTRDVALRSLGVPAILVFHGKDTSDAAVQVNKAVRRIHPAAEEVFIASVIDLSSFPSMFRSMVEPELEKAYFNQAGKIPPGADPAGLVVLFPDWDGAVHEQVGLRNTTEKAAVIVADQEGRIIARDQGDDPAAAVLEALADLAGT